MQIAIITASISGPRCRITPVLLSSGRSVGFAGGDGNSSGVYGKPDIGARLAPLAILLSRSPSRERF